jgi:UDP-glucose 4-epimerase
MLAAVIPITAVRLLSGGTPEVHGLGDQSRDFIYVYDTVDAVIKLYDVLPSGETVNISTNNQISINELISKICSHFGYQGEILRKTARHSDVMSHNASNNKVMGLIQYSLTPFEQGLARTLEWYEQRLRD